MYEIRGKGRIERLGKSKWQVRHSLGKDNLTGKYLRSPWRTVQETRTDAKRALEMYRREQQQ